VLITLARAKRLVERSIHADATRVAIEVNGGKKGARL